MNCKNCKYCKYAGAGIAGGFKCTHPDLEESANKYERLNGKRMIKARSHIGYTMIKTSLRYCPFRMLKEPCKDDYC